MQNTQRGPEDPLNRLFAILSHPYRRRILLRVSECTTADKDEIAVETIAPEDDNKSDFKSQLYHIHLPKLGEAGFIAWDREANAVRRGSNFDELAPVLRLLDNHQDELPAKWP